MNSPILRERACSMLKLLPLFFAIIGRVISHVEGARSVLMSFILHCWPVSLDLILTSFCWLYSCLSRLIFFLMLFIWIYYLNITSNFEFTSNFFVRCKKYNFILSFRQIHYISFIAWHFGRKIAAYHQAVL